MKYLLLLLSIPLFCKAQLSQQLFERNNEIRMVFYNVENIFDPADDPLTRDEEFTPDGDRHWDKYKYYEKLNRSAKALIATGGFEPPEIIGLCEIENKKVLNDFVYNTALKQFKYGITHFESRDRRGIDVGLLYRKDKFKLIQSGKILIDFPWDKNYYTRDILWTTLAYKSDTFHVFVNHWPSRWRGQLETEKARMFVAQTLRNVTDSLYKNDQDVKIIVMGDFNDTPANKSIKDVLIGDDKPYLTNLMNDILLFPGSNKYINDWTYIDQMIISVGFKTQNGLGYIDKSALPCAFGFLLELDKKNLGIKPKRTFIGLSYQPGFSDHLPIKADFKFFD
jgi:hypothetical protein